PCSTRRPWLANGFAPLGLVTSSWVFFSTPVSRSAHSTASPSFSNKPSSYATSSARPWNGAVVSRTSFFIGRLLDGTCAQDIRKARKDRGWGPSTMGALYGRGGPRFNYPGQLHTL